MVICTIAILTCSCKSTHKTETTKVDSNRHKIETVNNSIDKVYTFPDDWLGYWKGNIRIFDTNGLKQELPIALDNSLTENPGEYTWAIIYGSDTIKGRRDYILKTVDAKNGHFVTDEKNGILIDSYVIDNELVSAFEVSNNTITSTYKLDGEDMLFEILMYSSKNPKITGDTIIAGENIPPVKSYGIKVVQKARLKRVR